MIIKKITVGFVIQTFDTEKVNKEGKAFCLGQDFIASDETSYEDMTGDLLDITDVETEHGVQLAYEPFLMTVQSNK